MRAVNYLIIVLFVASLVFFQSVFGWLKDQPAEAAVMSSTDYSIERDSINFGGGLGTSSDYSLENTLGEAASGYSSSTTYMMSAGYQQMDGTYVSVSVPTAVSLIPKINLVTGGSASSSAEVTVRTNNTMGYTLLLAAGATPALQSGSTGFSDYLSSNPTVPDYVWSLGSATSTFGYSVEGNDITNLFRDDGVSCNIVSGNDTADTCWFSFSTVNQPVSASVSSNITGAVTTVKLKAEASSTSNLSVGLYQANLVATAYAN